MASRFEYLCLVILQGYFISALYQSPKIFKETEDIILDVGENYNLTCQGTEPLTWSYPSVTEPPKNEWTLFNIINSEESDNNDYTYQSVLNIINMSYPFVGYYTCKYESEDHDDMDQVYIYINDSEHLTIEDKYKIHYAAQNQETTIPCRPTNPDIRVELISYGKDYNQNEDGFVIKEKISKHEDHYNTLYHFDPKNGFWTNDTFTEGNEKRSCIFFGEKANKTMRVTTITEASRAFLATPYIEDISFNHTDVGSNLQLNCNLREDSVNILFVWKTPRGTFSRDSKKEGNLEISTLKNTDINGKQYLVSTLSIENTSLEDSGKYNCSVSDRQGHSSSSEIQVVIHDANTCFIQIREENNQNYIETEAGLDVKWILEVNAHPIPELTWYDNEGHKIKNDSKYYTDMTAGKAIFTISNVSVENNGTYKVKGISSRHNPNSTCQNETHLELMLHVFDKPLVCLDLDPRKECKEKYIQRPKFFRQGETARIKCQVRGNPPPAITWRYKECLNIECTFKESKGENQHVKNMITTSFLNINTSQDGIIECIGDNSFGSDTSSINYTITDIKNGFDLYNFGDGAIVNKSRTTTEVIIAANSTLTFTCAVSPKKSQSMEIFYNNHQLNKNYITDYKNDSLSMKSTISLYNAKFTDEGLYSCRILNLHNKLYEFKNVSFIVKEPTKPKIDRTNWKNVVTIEYPGKPFKLHCNYSGIPKPDVEWYKNDKKIVPSGNITFEENESILNFLTTRVSDEGIYRCKVTNAYDSDEVEASLKFGVKPVSFTLYYSILGAIGLLLLVAIIYIIIKINKERALKRELKSLGLENFHNGNPENLNPELGIDDQAELLPYNKKWEFPVEQLKLGKQLGSGAFGVVLKAEARRIVDGEEKTTVAVKMVKKNADQSYIKALASELKIMVHLGKHINVVNLLGACTKNVAKRELYVIVEYCRFGNLQNYLFKHRASFINQVDQVSGKIDYDIGMDILERSYSISSETTNYGATRHSMRDYRGRDTSAGTQLTSVGEDCVILSNNSIQPEWRLNYRGDYKGNVKPVCTSDLIIWSFQIARGMDYLASRKVLHGDLASRNILLADNNIVKICDFGLAKTMYNDNNYKKKGNSPLPVKWMAIESIRDRVFSTQSDVWSFGIVLWELFSLARTPYPGMEADERLFYKLVEGYRMESPAYAPKEIYQIMLDCWNAKPLSRPSFTKLVDKIGMLLQESVQKHYIDLNDPYLKMNTQKLEEDDYLAMLSPPSFDILSTPVNYVNGDVSSGSRQGPSGCQTPGAVQDGYLFMGSNAIFSPRVQNDDVFDFSTGKRKNSNSDKENQESRPMLQSYNESDSESGYLSPISANSISNPSYHIPPRVSSENFINQNPKTPDNYITMPQYKNLVNSNIKGSNNKPVTLDLEKNSDKVHYVNSDAQMWSSVDV